MAMFDFAGSTQKQIVGVAVTPNIGVEVMLIDKKSNKVIKYGRRPMQYNASSREIEDYNAFKSLVIDLFHELDINTKSNVLMVLPNVHFGFISLPLIINDEAIHNAILAQAEESYVFKRIEPVSAWMDVNLKGRADNKYLVYSSFQKTAVDEIIEVFSDIGSNLIGIETSYAAFLRGIYFSGAAKEEIKEGYNWNIILIGSNSYALFSMAGERLVDYTEVPLAIRSFSYEEAYQAIASSVSQILPNYPARKLLVVSQTDDICAEVLKTQIPYDEDISSIDCNKYTKSPIVKVDSSINLEDAKAMSLNVLGAAVYQATDFPLALNILDKTSGTSSTMYFSMDIFGKEVLFTPELAKNVCLYIAGGLLIFFVLLYFALVLSTKALQENGAKITLQTDTVKAQLGQLSGEGGIVDIGSLINRINNQNKKAISFYDSLASDIPKNIWLTYYYNKDGDKVAIEGLSSDINDIYTYYNSLKVISPGSSIKLNKLKVITDVLSGEFDFNADTDIRLYDFEIANTASKKSAGTQNQEAQPVTPASQNATPQNMMPPAPPPMLEPIPSDNFTN